MMTNEDKAEILREIAKLLANAKEEGDYYGAEERFQSDIELTFRSLSSEFEQRANELDQDPYSAQARIEVR